jgi:hypothetical protein
VAHWGPTADAFDFAVMHEAFPLSRNMGRLMLEAGLESSRSRGVIYELQGDRIFYIHTLGHELIKLLDQRQLGFG